MLKANLSKLIFAFWSAMHPGHALPGDAQVVADAIVTSTLEDAAGGLPPVLGSYDEDIAAQAYWADKESNVRVHPAHWIDPKTGKPVDSLAFGTYQTHRLGDDATALDYARDWRRQFRDGKRFCPESPLAPLSGSCHLARPLADRREHAAQVLLVTAIASMPSDLDEAVTSSEPTRPQD